MLELARGRWAAAQPHFAARNALDPGTGYWNLSAAMPAPFVPPTDLELAAVRDSVAAWRPDPEIPNRLLFLGLLTARLGEAERAEAIAAGLEGSFAAFAEVYPSMTVSYSRNQALTLRAQAAASQGRYEEALRLLEQVGPMEGWIGGSSLFRQVRWLEAEALYALGRYEEALPWYEGFEITYGVGSQPFVAPARFRIGQIHEQLGNPEMAARHYNRFLKRWEGCDPEFQPWVDQARRALERLTAER
jgi:tetratricopeptide (TPR) repeat protein